MRKKNNYRKYTAVSMAAAAAATSVAPVVSAAPVNDGFIDVTNSTISDENIRDGFYKLIEKGAIHGYPDGTFRPYQPIYRGQMAKILTKALDLPIPNNIGAINSKYKDAASFKDDAKYIAAVTEAGIFKGNDKNEFGFWDTTTRQQFASVLFNYMTSMGIQPKENVYINLQNVSDTHKLSVQYLADLGLTTQFDDYRAYKDMTRIQFATFFVLAQDMIKPAEVEVTDEIREAINNATSKDEIKEILKEISVLDDVTKDMLEAIIEGLWGIVDKGGSFDSNEQLEDTIKDPLEEIDRIDQEEADQVADSISKLTFADESSPTTAEKTAVQEARAAYEALTQAQKELVPDQILDELEAAEKTVAAHETNQEAVDRVTTAIENLTFADESSPTAREVDAVKKARTHYEELTDAQKALITTVTVDKLAVAEKVIADAVDNDNPEGAEGAVNKAETSKSQKDYDAAKKAVDQLPNGPEKDALLKRLDKVSEIIQSAKPEASFRTTSTSLFTAPIIKELDDQEKTSGGLIGLNIGIVDLGVLSGNQISELSKNENNIYQFTVDKDHERDVNVSVAIHTVLGGKAYTLNVYKKTGEDELTRIDQIRDSNGGALGIAVPNKHDLGTFEEGEYTVLLAMEEGVTVVEVVPFRMYDVVERDYSQVSTNDSIVSSNLLDNQQLGAKNEAVVSSVNSTSIGTKETEVEGKYGKLYITQNGEYRYVPTNNRDNIGKTEAFEYTIKNTYNNKVSKNELQIKLNGVNTARE